VVSTSTAPPSPDVVERAYRACARVARDHYENFPVASMLVPTRMRRGVAAVYAFARRADDFADEPGYSDGERLRLLDDWQQRLLGAAAGSTPSESMDDLIFVAVADAMQVHQLPVSLFADLLSAFRQDVTVRRYQTWNDVLDYCARSANPVGRLVLRIAGYADTALDRSSDALCTALQLTNFWQDFGRDWRAGRLYVPRDVVVACRAREMELEGPQLTESWMAALATCIARTRACFEAGREICTAVSGRLGFELRFTWLGGSRMLDLVERTGAALLIHRPSLGARDVPSIVWRAVFWPSHS
jgi:squalene synthase HpnC